MGIAEAAGQAVGVISSYIPNRYQEELYNSRYNRQLQDTKAMNLENMNTQYEFDKKMAMYNEEAAARAAQQSQNYAKEMSGINFDYNEQAADNAAERSKQMWLDTSSYVARMKDMKAAGVNPALMMASGGGSGMNVQNMASGGGAGNGSGARQEAAGMRGVRSSDASSMISAASQQSIQGLQAENIRANTISQKADAVARLAEAGLTPAKKKNLEADTEETQANVNKIVQEAQNLATEGNIRNRVNEREEKAVINAGLTAMMDPNNVRYVEGLNRKNAFEKSDYATVYRAGLDVMGYTDQTRLFQESANVVLDGMQKAADFVKTQEEAEAIEKYIKIAAAAQVTNAKNAETLARRLNLDKTIHTWQAINGSIIALAAAAGAAGQFIPKEAIPKLKEIRKTTTRTNGDGEIMMQELEDIINMFE